MNKIKLIIITFGKIPIAISVQNHKTTKPTPTKHGVQTNEALLKLLKIQFTFIVTRG